MLPKELSLVLRKYKSKVFIYAWEYFSRRIHDELVRSVLEESQFFYTEINFSIIQKRLNDNGEELLRFWEIFFEVLSTQKRHCDLCGFLDNNVGLAFLFVDSVSNTDESNPAWDRLCNEITSRTSINIQKLEGIISAEYPPKEFFIPNQFVKAEA